MNMLHKIFYLVCGFICATRGFLPSCISFFMRKESCIPTPPLDNRSPLYCKIPHALCKSMEEETWPFKPPLVGFPDPLNRKKHALKGDFLSRILAALNNNQEGAELSPNLLAEVGVTQRPPKTSLGYYQGPPVMAPPQYAAPPPRRQTGFLEGCLAALCCCCLIDECCCDPSIFFVC